MLLEGLCRFCPRAVWKRATASGKKGDDPTPTSLLGVTAHVDLDVVKGNEACGAATQREGP
jgi:hypothetical protein